MALEFFLHAADFAPPANVSQPGCRLDDMRVQLGWQPLARKYARDFLQLVELVSSHEVECVWQEHRKSQSFESCAETVRQLRRVVGSRSDLLNAPTYSTKVLLELERIPVVDAAVSNWGE